MRTSSRSRAFVGGRPVFPQTPRRRPHSAGQLRAHRRARFRRLSLRPEGAARAGPLPPEAQRAVRRDSAAIKLLGAAGREQRTEVVAAVAPLEIVSRYEAPFRAAGMLPGLVTTSALAALELAPEGGITVFVKITGRVLSVLVRSKGALKLARCMEMPSAGLEDVSAVLGPTFVYVEDIWRGDREAGPVRIRRATEEAARRFGEELSVETEPLRSPARNAGRGTIRTVGLLRSIARNN